MPDLGLPAARAARPPGDPAAAIGLSSPSVFDLLVAALLLPLGVWLAGARPPVTGIRLPARHIPASVLAVLACVAVCVGGIHGIGGGAILSPVLIGSDRPAAEVAPAALASTFVTSLGGVLTFTLLSMHQARSHRTGPPASRWASAASPAATPQPGSSPGSRTP